MTVYSSLKGEGNEFAWLLPVPASPTELGAVSPGFVKNLSRGLQPKIVTKKPRGLYAFSFFSAFLVPLTALVLFLGGVRKSRKVLAVFSYLFIAMAAFSFLTFLPWTLDYKGESAGVQSLSYGVTLEQEVQIGNYDVSVLDVTSSDSLNSWLEDNGFQHVPEDGRAIVADYIDNGWRFVAAKLSRSGGGYGRPHPIEVTFPSDAPIYPMRLTALSGSELYLELMVIADERAGHPLLETDISDQFALGEAASFDSSEMWYLTKDAMSYISEDEKPSLYTGSFGSKIGHPGAVSRMWDGCTVTKLTGTLSPTDMSEDFEIALSSPKRHRDVFFLGFVAKSIAKIIANFVWVFGIILFMCFANKLLWRRSNFERNGVLLITMLLLFQLRTGVIAGTNELLPKIHQYDNSVRREHNQQGSMGWASDLPILVGIYDGCDKWTTEKIEACYEIERKNASYLSIHEIRDILYFADEPGGFALETENDQTAFHLYDANGAPWLLDMDKWSMEYSFLHNSSRIAKFRKQLAEPPELLDEFEWLRHGDDSAYLNLQIQLGERSVDDVSFMDWSIDSECFLMADRTDEEAETFLRISQERYPSLTTIAIMEGLRFNYPDKVATAARQRLEKLLGSEDYSLSSLYPDTVILMRITHEVPATPLSRKGIANYLDRLGRGEGRLPN